MRPLEIMSAVTAELGGLKWWKHYDRLLADRISLGDWPAWCYCPLAGAHAIVTRGSEEPVSFRLAHLVAELGAVAAWRPTKGVYRFAPELAAALTSTDLSRELPGDILTRPPGPTCAGRTGISIRPGRAGPSRGCAGFIRFWLVLGRPCRQCTNDQWPPPRRAAAWFRLSDPVSR